MIRNVADIKMIGTEYVAFYYEKEISRGKSLEKVAKKLHHYIKGQM